MSVRLTAQPTERRNQGSSSLGSNWALRVRSSARASLSGSTLLCVFVPKPPGAWGCEDGPRVWLHGVT